MRTVKDALREASVSYNALAGELGISKAAVVAIVNDGRFPKHKEKKVRDAVNGILTARNVDVTGIWKYLDGRDDEDEDDETQEVNVMLSQAAKRQFGVFQDPYPPAVYV